MRNVLLGFLALFATVTSIGAQQVSLQGETDDPAVVEVNRILTGGNYLLLGRDTVLGPNTAIPGDVVIAGARVALEGEIAGSVAVLDADFFVRPRGRVGGTVAVIGFGGAYLSGSAEVGEVLHIDPRIAVTVERGATEFRVLLRPPRTPGVLRLPNLYGLGLPTYDRVNGLSLPWGAAAGFGGTDTATVLLSGTATYRTGRGRLDPAAGITLRPSSRSLIQLSAARYTRTNESWIRGDLANTLAALGVGSDVRDYFESDELRLTVARTPPPPLIPGESFVAPLLSARLSRDRSIRAREPWSFFGGDDWRPNPTIDQGTLASLVAGATFGWRGAFSELTGATAVEWSPSGLGDFEFAQLSAIGAWTMPGMWDHRFRVSGYLLTPIGSREAPLQRWSFVGGTGTLPTLPTGLLRGDHVVFVNSIYLAPLPYLVVPLIGRPALRLEHSIGTAWRSGDARPPLDQNVGAGLQLSIFNFMVFADPSERPRRFTISFGAQLPGSIRLGIL